ncbi:hypothetical protein MMU07_19670 [Aquiflexum sp. LQ15W]|uniref:hypothetical protein n=1 Tax=Cognataquiflexum nitidum TaxID=2922272 RepID=UPI001F12E765|nr:hypothetical protein [Cognataquiflexum nitidum]MCH6201808.1 hypothetical protein [Cognataquiflexum nitidum]
MTKSEENIDQTFINFVTDFITKDKQDRILLFYKNKKNWWKIKIEFHTSNPFDTKRLNEILPNEQYAEKIYLKMKSLGTKEECVSLLDYLNDEPYTCQLEEKLSDTVGFLFETIIYCPKSKTGYFEGGHAKDRYILKY